MANPNIKSPTTIQGENADVALTTGGDVIVNNAASSGKLIVVVGLTVANIDGSAAADVTINRHPEDDGGGTGVPLASTISVPADAVLVLASKDKPILLKEDQSIEGIASADGDLVANAEWYELS